MRLSYVLPVHNEEAILRKSVQMLVVRLAEMPGSEIIMVENGSRDRSALVAKELSEEFATGPVQVIAESSPQGFGHAWRRGMEVARGDVILLSATDIPFGFSDLDGYLELEDPPALVIGSKAHPDSIIATGKIRRILSRSFNLARRMILRSRVGDTQGAFFLRRDLARSLLPALRSPNYFISTEIAVLAAERGIEPLEIPVRYVDPRRDSKVRPMRDGYEMLKNIFELRRRLRRQHG